MAISAMGGGFHKEMLHILPEILDRILTLLKDSVINLMLQLTIQNNVITNVIIICLAS